MHTSFCSQSTLFQQKEISNIELSVQNNNNSTIGHQQIDNSEIIHHEKEDKREIKIDLIIDKHSLDEI